MSSPPTSTARRRGLGCYVSPGRVSDPRVALAEAVLADRNGLDAIWIAEKYDFKDLPALAGAIGARTTSVRIGAAVTHPGVRHPMVVASMGQTLQALTGERFRIGFGGAIPQKWQDYGVAVPTRAMFGDLAQLLRQLWAGEAVSYDGPLGRYPNLRLETLADLSPPPLLLAAVGPKMLDLAGSHFDGVILHPFLTVDAVARSAGAVRRAAEAAGRDPATITVVSAVVVAVDAAPAAEEAIVAARALRYLRTPGLGEAIVTANGWDAAGLEPMRVKGARPAPSTVVPRTWLESSAGIGTANNVRGRLGAYFDAGIDEIILHGSTAHQLDGVDLRPAVRL
jgi:5,10-methylenetetrahydromethanopterin reductase